MQNESINRKILMAYQWLVKLWEGKELHGKKKDADKASAENWIRDWLSGFRNGFQPDEMCNTDEIGLYLRVILDYCLVFKKETSGNYK
ncbi:hypothetical protein Trydic_g19052 [Trypoxylus dichotomus]